MNKVTIGIDPGKEGAFFILFPCGSYDLMLMPVTGKEINVETLRDLLNGHREDEGQDDFDNWHAWIEESCEVGYKPADERCHACNGGGRVHIKDGRTRPCSCRTRQGLRATSRLLHGAGLVEGCLRTLGIKCTRISAPAWQSVALGLRRTKQPIKERRAALKAASIKMAKIRFPSICLRRTDRSRVDDHNLADAANIAWVGSRCSEGTPK